MISSLGKATISWKSHVICSDSDPTLSTRCFLTLDILSNVNKIKATEHFFLVALLIMLYKVVLTFESVDEILWCDHSNKRYWAVPSCGIVNYSVEGLIVETADEILWCDHSVKATEQYFPVVLFIMLYKVVLTFASVDETVGVNIQMKATWAVLSCWLCCTRWFKCLSLWMKSNVETFQIILCILWGKTGLTFANVWKTQSVLVQISVLLSEWTSCEIS